MTDKDEIKNLKEDLASLKSEIQDRDKEIQAKDAELQKKVEEIQTKDKDIEDYRDQTHRLQADFENFKKRSEKDIKEYIKYANEGLILKILDVYEDFERALETEKSDDLKEGVEIIYKKLKKILEGEGLRKIECEGEKFDPFKHEALMVEDNDDFEDGTVLEELAKGYTLDSKVIKYSKVKVCKKK
ncbi:Protein GrpE [anaerobic digester metagenome]